MSTRHRPPTEREAALAGPIELKRYRSPEWCWQQIYRLKRGWQHLDSERGRFDEVWEEIQAARVWEVVPPEQPYGSLDALLLSEIGTSEFAVKERIAPTKERVRLAAVDLDTGEILERGRIPIEQIGKLPISKQPQRAEESGIGVRTQRKLDYLARHATDLFARVQAGDLSADAAYRMARNKPRQCTHEVTPAAFARAALKHLTDDQIEELIELLEGGDC